MGKKYKQNAEQINKIVDICLKKLQPLGVYIHNRAVNTASVYLKFGDPRLKSLTIRDHKTIPKYRYKWNIILGYQGEARVIDAGITRYMYNEHQIDRLCAHILNYHRKIKQNAGNV